MPKKIREKNKIRHAARGKFAILADACQRQISRMNVDPDVADQLHALCGLHGRSQALIASDLVARWFGAKAFSRMLLHMAAASPDRRFHMATFIDDSGKTSDRTPIVCQQHLIDKVRRTIAKRGLQAICVVEVHPLTNYPARGDGRTLLWHVHALLWSDDPDVDYREIENEFNASRAFSCDLGAKPVDIRPVKQDPEDLARVGHYLMKPPHSGKNRMLDAKHAGQYILMDTIKGYPDQFALRVMEGLSQIAMTSLVFGIGKEGAAKRQAWRKKVEAWHARRAFKGTIIDQDVDIWKLWHDVRQRDKKSHNYLPYRFGAAPPAKGAAAVAEGRTTPGRRQ